MMTWNQTFPTFRQNLPFITAVILHTVSSICFYSAILQFWELRNNPVLCLLTSFKFLRIALWTLRLLFLFSKQTVLLHPVPHIWVSNLFVFFFSQTEASFWRLFPAWPTGFTCYHCVKKENTVYTTTEPNPESANFPLKFAACSVFAQVQNTTAKNDHHTKKNIKF